MQKLTLSPLPYGYNELEPIISQQIMELHHDKHHAAYVTAANTAMEKIENYRKSGAEINLREVMRDLSFNGNGAMLHDMFWQNMRKPTENNKAGGTLASLLQKDFGSFENFQREFGGAAVGVEGSGWAVLWKTPMGLTVGQLEKHNLLGLAGAIPILVLDVWEHAYYAQYLNNRAEYVNKWWNVVNWDDVDKRYLVE